MDSMFFLLQAVKFTRSTKSKILCTGQFFLAFLYDILYGWLTYAFTAPSPKRMFLFLSTLNFKIDSFTSGPQYLNTHRFTFIHELRDIRDIG